MLGVFNKCANSWWVRGGVLGGKAFGESEGCKVFESEEIDSDDSVSDGKTDGDNSTSDGKTNGDDFVSDRKTDGDNSISDTSCKKALKPLVWAVILTDFCKIYKHINIL